MSSAPSPTRSWRRSTAWQQHLLDPVYPVVILNALRVKIRDEGVVRNKAVCLAIGIARDGTKDVLGLWIEQTEGAAFWLRIMTELKSRGIEDILIALIDGLAGFPEAITTVFPTVCRAARRRTVRATGRLPGRSRNAGRRFATISGDPHGRNYSSPHR